MSSLRARKDNGLLFFDFRFRGVRCRELTLLEDTPTNRKRLQKILDKLQAEIDAGTFVYEAYFPNSKTLARLKQSGVSHAAGAHAPNSAVPDAAGPDQPTAAQAATPAAASAPAASVPVPSSCAPGFREVAHQWLELHQIEWRRSHIRALVSTLEGRLIPHFGDRAVDSITKTDILAFRTALAKVPGRAGREGLSSKRINEIVGTLRQILNEAADRFQFSPPAAHIKRLKVRKVDVQPFSLADVQRILATVRADFKPYFIVRFFTGMRTGEVHGLKWKYVDFERRLIQVRETFVLGEDEYTKTEGSQRDIQMSRPVFEALQVQWQTTGAHSPYVFCNLAGEPLDNKNFSDRVWYPLLRHLGLAPRRPYQMRHTAATLWLACGEAPEWIARQLGHTSTEMLFRVYSRYVPNLTRRDGSAIDQLLASRMAPLLTAGPPGDDVTVTDSPQPIPQPIPKPRGLHTRRPATQAQGPRAPTPALVRAPAPDLANHCPDDPIRIDQVTPADSTAGPRPEPPLVRITRVGRELGQPPPRKSSLAA